MAQTGYAPRRAAGHLLDQIIDEGRLMSELIGGGALKHLDAGDTARAQRLAVETLRGLDRADRMLKPFLKRKPGGTVMNVLRLGTVEICAEGAAAHGVVNSAVTLARQRQSRRDGFYSRCQRCRRHVGNPTGKASRHDRHR